MGDGSMNADTNAAVAPGGSLRLGRGFGAVFVAAIVGEDRTVGRRHLLVAELLFYRIAAVAANCGARHYKPVFPSDPQSSVISCRPGERIRPFRSSPRQNPGNSPDRAGGKGAPREDGRAPPGSRKEP